ncbi:hypothetical protein [Elizabethkingia ursingii]|uniref:hypothetical protein n=1 Tax=Elizabethkingia ursingii TaxID=1756150 RepID=UPI001F3AB37D|nr:hypothetical protein [Elizabethkingia ursingii]
MKNYLTIFVLLSSFVFAQKAPQDLSDFQKIFDQQLKTWKASIPGFSVQNFKAHNNFGFDNISQEDQPVREFTTFVKNYKDLLIFSPDKNILSIYTVPLSIMMKRKRNI